MLAERRIDTDGFGHQKIYRKQVTHVNELRSAIYLVESAFRARLKSVGEPNTGSREQQATL